MNYCNYLEKENYSESSSKGYVYQSEKFSQWMVTKGYSLEHFDYKQALQYVAYLQNKHSNIKTINHKIVAIRRYFYYLMEMAIQTENPFIDINIKGSAILLEACKKFNKDVKIIYTGTRGEYGSAVKLPVKEDAPLNPKGIYELSSLTAQKLFKIYNDNHGVRSVTLRLTNIYGERAQMQHHRFGVVNWFIRLAIDNQTIKVFGDGSILRDFLYVQDAGDAILKCAMCDKAYGEVFNVGVDKPTSFLELAKTIIEVAGSGKWEFAPFTPERAAQEPGDFYSDITKIKTVVGWKPKVELKDGIAKTIEYYRKYKKFYW